MDKFFHHPDELNHEITQAKFKVTGFYGVEGPCWLLPDFDSWWRDINLKKRLLQIARKVESEPSLLVVSSYLLAVVLAVATKSDEFVSTHRLEVGVTQ